MTSKSIDHQQVSCVVEYLADTVGMRGGCGGLRWPLTDGREGGGVIWLHWVR
jgi:hypothetical protein